MMTVQMIASTHAANNISVNDIYSRNTVGQVDSVVASQVKYSPKQATPKMRAVSEVIIPSFSDSKTIVSTIIASLTQQNSDRWTTWITSTAPNKELLTSLGACLSRLRIVYINPEDDARWVIWQALAQGNSHNVIAEQTGFSTSDMQQMEIAATEGGCKGMMISCA